jgi:hypothetical protein
MAMSILMMDFYNAESGVQFTLEWRNEAEYALGKEFLKNLLGDEGGASAHEPGRIPFYYLKNDQDRDALLDFRRELREHDKDTR